ncbi:unnamed protein product [marine sediment metagenome]|uniref:Uncharacterized protein n=1 Tax=marine sediment metagenome TaxID=412755 RepID=X0RIY6_9ZZZZ
MKIYNKQLESADNIIIKTYYKCQLERDKIKKIPDIIVTDISDLMIGNTVKFKSGKNDIETSVNKEALKYLINLCGGYSD